jgi:FkbM family methyltransferase
MIPNKIVNSNYGPMIINANDQYIGRSIEVYGAWAKDDIDLIAGLVELLLQKKDHITFYDVGANIGTHTVAVAQRFANRVTVRSFEAQRQVYYVLCGNVAINGLDNVHVHHAAVSDVADDAIQVDLPDYTMPNNFGGLELIKTQRSDNQSMTKTRTETVATVTIDQFTETVDFLKLDIEGMEHLALIGAKQTIKQHRPICFVEMWKTDTDAVKQFFKQANYRAYAYKLDDWIFFPAEGDLGLVNQPPETL